MRSSLKSQLESQNCNPHFCTSPGKQKRDSGTGGKQKKPWPVSTPAAALNRAARLRCRGPGVVVGPIRGATPPWQGADGIHTWRKLVSPDWDPHPSYKPWSPADGDMPVWDIVNPPGYSSYWEAMEQIVIQMRQRGWEWAIFSIESGLFVVNFRKSGISSEAAESGAPLAVVKAAMLALAAEQEASNG